MDFTVQPILVNIAASIFVSERKHDQIDICNIFTDLGINKIMIKNMITLTEEKISIDEMMTAKRCILNSSEVISQFRCVNRKDVRFSEVLKSEFMRIFKRNLPVGCLSIYPDQQLEVSLLQNNNILYFGTNPE